MVFQGSERSFEDLRVEAGKSYVYSAYALYEPGEGSEGLEVGDESGRSSRCDGESRAARFGSAAAAARAGVSVVMFRKQAPGNRSSNEGDPRLGTGR